MPAQAAVLCVPVADELELVLPPPAAPVAANRRAKTELHQALSPDAGTAGEFLCSHALVWD